MKVPIKSIRVKKVFLSISVFILFPFFLFAQNVFIKGKATGAEGKTLSIYAWSDQITYTQAKIASGKIDSAGKFDFSFKADKTFFAYLKVDFNEAPIYIEPGKTYDLSISCPDCNSPDDKTNPYLEPKQLDVIINGSDSLELNNMVMRFNKMNDDFILENYITLIKQRNRALVDTFRTETNKRFASVKNDYFKSLVRYRFAMIEELAQLNSIEGLSKKYLWNQPVMYDNTGYMEFFNEFFKNYVTAQSKHITRYDLDTTINSQKSVPAFLDTLGKDSLLRNEVVREMVALKTLGEIYYLPQFSKAAILGMLTYIKENSKFPQHRQIAENYLNFFTKLAPGSVAPGFKLKDYSGADYSLGEFNQNKYVYLIFWTTWCVPCISEMELIGKLKDKYGTKVEFVGISADKEFMTYYYFMQKNNKFDFTNLHWGNNADLIENYDVKAYPTFVLIGPDGKIVQYPAESPSGLLDPLLYDLTKNKK
jgi:thiol-disulfide isomerase/thioredoxin